MLLSDAQRTGQHRTRAFFIMINEFNELKNFILSFNIFEDNQFLDEYCNLILLNLTKEKIKYKTQRHHFIAVCYYKYTYKLSRKDAIIYSE